MTKNKTSRRRCSLLLLFFLTGCSDRGTPFVAPSISDLRTINAQLYNRPDSGADIDRFEVPKADHRSVLDLLDGAQPDNDPMKWQILGHIEMVLPAGSIDVDLFWTDQQVGAFEVDGSYYRGGSDAGFIEVISAAQKRWSEQQRSEPPKADLGSPPDG